MSNPTTHDGAVLGSDGLHQDRPGTISTWQGRIDPLHPDQDEVNVNDIAHALARLCRYNGHVGGFLSVARHSIWVSERLHAESYEVQLAGLLHDGAEAYLSDIPRPVKRAPEMAVFREFDQRMDAAVMAHFGLPFPMAQAVTDADRYVLMEVELPNPAGARYTWNSVPQEDEKDFLARYYYLTDRIERVGSERGLPPIIGLSGYARSGKDSVGGILRSKGYRRRAFADKLKSITAQLDPIVTVGCGAPDLGETSVCCDRLHVSELMELGADEDWLKEHTTFRVFLQNLGGTVRDELGESTWVDAALAGRQDGLRYVITDVRYPNEADAIKAAGGKVWRVNRPGTEPANEHASEHAMDSYPFDTVVENDEHLPALRFKVARTLEVL